MYGDKLITTIKNKSIRSRFSMNRLSIRGRILLVFVIVIVIMSSLNVTLMISSLKYNSQYNTIVSNITNANSINGYLKTSIDSEMWNIVSGKIKFPEGKQYKIMNDTKFKINQIMNNVNSKDSKIKLDVTLRTMSTLKHYVDIMGVQIKNNSRVAENEKILEEIRSVTQLIEEEIQDFMLFQLTSIEKVKNEIQININNWVITNIIVFSIALLFSVAAAWFISGGISKPIRELHRTTKSIAAGNLNVRVENENVDEIAGLGMSFNVMIQKIKELLENSKKEQETIKKSELKALQAQINPHFLYNTLDTIVWMAEANKSEQVIEIVKALSSFFRITLSKGKDWISVKDEIEHINSYLTIQKIRYRDILDFKIDISEEILDCKILKLTLQPIVENALYHGIKNKRGRGLITIKGGIMDRDRLLFEIVDNGVGITEERLKEISSELESGINDFVLKESGFGINNVQKRTQLYYGKQFGLTIESEFQVGTHVSLIIPIER
jgi:two-component system, sensor histidine kinase YesM